MPLMDRMDAELLRAKIRADLTPFAFTCECEGRHDDCAAVLNDPMMQTRRFIVEDVLTYMVKVLTDE